MKFVDFDETHFREYQSWFDQSNLDNYISYPDETWFRYLQCEDVTGIAVLDDNDELIAELQIDRDPDGDGYFAISVKPDQQGNGIAKEAIMELLKHGSIKDLKRLVAFVANDNDASRTVLEDSGFQHNGVEDQDGFMEFVYPISA